MLYQHLALASLGKRARSRAADSVLVASALFGVVGLDDPIPAYRLSMGARIPALRKGLPALWRPPLAKALPDEAGELVLDLRSGSYAAAWTPKHATLVSIRAVTPQGKVISHMAKATRGRVARAVLEARSMPREPEAVAALAGPQAHGRQRGAAPGRSRWSSARLAAAGRAEAALAPHRLPQVVALDQRRRLVAHDHQLGDPLARLRPRTARSGRCSAAAPAPRRGSPRRSARAC